MNLSSPSSYPALVFSMLKSGLGGLRFFSNPAHSRSKPAYSTLKPATHDSLYHLSHTHELQSQYTYIWQWPKLGDKAADVNDYSCVVIKHSGSFTGKFKYIQTACAHCLGPLSGPIVNKGKTASADWYKIASFNTMISSFSGPTISW